MGSVLAAIALAGMMTMKPKYYEVQEGDTICAVGFCFNRNYREILKKNPQVVDPDRIFPGQRCVLTLATNPNPDPNPNPVGARCARPRGAP